MLKNIFGEVDWKKLYLIENGYTQKKFVSWKIAEKYCLTSCLEKKIYKTFVDKLYKKIYKSYVYNLCKVKEAKTYTEEKLYT